MCLHHPDRVCFVDRALWSACGSRQAAQDRACLRITDACLSDAPGEEQSRHRGETHRALPSAHICGDKDRIVCRPPRVAIANLAGIDRAHGRIRTIFTFWHEFCFRNGAKGCFRTKKNLCRLPPGWAADSVFVLNLLHSMLLSFIRCPKIIYSVRPLSFLLFLTFLIVRCSHTRIGCNVVSSFLYRSPARHRRPRRRRDLPCLRWRMHMSSSIATHTHPASRTP